MEIQQNLTLRQLDYRAYLEAREARKNEHISKLQEVALAEQIEVMNEAERAAGIAYLNVMMGAAARFNDVRYPDDLNNIFPWPMDDLRIMAATTPRANDNDEARGVKREYKELYMQLKKELTHAQLLEKKLGPGTHRLVDADGRLVATVTITKDRSGNVTVTTVKPDGSKEEVSYNERTPGDCRIKKTDSQGNEEVMERRGTTCSRSRNGVADKYSIDENGRPVREKSGPGADDYEKTVVNHNGSTDRYDLIYRDENGNPVYEKTHQDPKGYQYQDEGAGKAIDELKAWLEKNPSKQISADQMYKLIYDATSDFDNQAAGKEYKDLKNFVTTHWNRLSPDAKALWGVYEKYVNEARSKGQTGIAVDQYDKMLGEMKKAGYQDESAGKAIEELKAWMEKNPNKQVSAEQMYTLIINATSDLDNQAAGKEYGDLEKFVETNWNRLSPEAKQIWNIFENYARSAQQKNQTGISQEDYAKMQKEMQEAMGGGKKKEEYQDESAGKAIDELKAWMQRNPGKKVSGDQMYALIQQATSDLDNQAAGKEYADLQKFVKENWDKLSPDAKAMWGVYEKYVKEAQGKGQTGIDQSEYEKMLGEMKGARYADESAGAAIEDLKAKNLKIISGKNMYELIIKATSDRDNRAAGKEYQDLEKYVEANWNSLSPEARNVWNIYENHARSAQQRGETGISDRDYDRMVAEMQAAIG